MISIGTRFLEDSRDTAHDFGPPRGLFVLIMTAVSYISRVRYFSHVQVYCSLKG